MAAEDGRERTGLNTGHDLPLKQFHKSSTGEGMVTHTIRHEAKSIQCATRIVYEKLATSEHVRPSYELVFFVRLSCTPAATRVIMVSLLRSSIAGLKLTYSFYQRIFLTTLTLVVHLPD